MLVEIVPILIKGSMPTATTKQNVNPAVYFVYLRVKNGNFHLESQLASAKHLVYVKEQDQTFLMVYDICWRGAATRFCVKAEKLPNHC
jgi:hypothetical protein